MGFLRKAALLSACLGVQPSMAADQGFYFGLQGGQAKYEFAVELPRFSSVSLVVPEYGGIAGGDAFGFSDVVAPNVSYVSPVAGGTPLRAFWLPRDDDKSTAFSGLVGYQIFPYAAVELAYARLGTLHEYQPAAFFSSGRLLSPAVSSELESSAVTLSALATIPLTAHWDAYLRGGALLTRQKVTHSSSLANDATTYGSDALLFGAGTQWNFADHWTVRLDFQRYDDVGEEDGVGAADIDVWSLGVLFRL